jgi:hypothetical protein
MGKFIEDIELMNLKRKSKEFILSFLKRKELTPSFLKTVQKLTPKSTLVLLLNINKE